MLMFICGALRNVFPVKNKKFVVNAENHIELMRSTAGWENTLLLWKDLLLSLEFWSSFNNRVEKGYLCKQKERHIRCLNLFLEKKVEHYTIYFQVNALSSPHTSTDQSNGFYHRDQARQWKNITVTLLPVLPNIFNKERTLQGIKRKVVFENWQLLHIQLKVHSCKQMIKTKWFTLYICDGERCS